MENIVINIYIDLKLTILKWIRMCYNNPMLFVLNDIWIEIS